MTARVQWSTCSANRLHSELNNDHSMFPAMACRRFLSTSSAAGVRSSATPNVFSKSVNGLRSFGFAFALDCAAGSFLDEGADLHPEILLLWVPFFNSCDAEGQHCVRGALFSLRGCAELACERVRFWFLEALAFISASLALSRTERFWFALASETQPCWLLVIARMAGCTCSQVLNLHNCTIRAERL